MYMKGVVISPVEMYTANCSEVGCIEIELENDNILGIASWLYPGDCYP